MAVGLQKHLRLAHVPLLSLQPSALEASNDLPKEVTELGGKRGEEGFFPHRQYLHAVVSVLTVSWICYSCRHLRGEPLDQDFVRGTEGLEVGAVREAALSNANGFEETRILQLAEDQRPVEQAAFLPLIRLVRTMMACTWHGGVARTFTQRMKCGSV